MTTEDPLDFHYVDSAGFCRTCGEAVSGLPPAARYCPGCGRHVRPPLSRLAHLRRLVENLYGRPPNEVPPSGPSTRILVGYGNALFSLGWRYERGAAARRNLPEAIRCYRKSARLGNADASVRLGRSAAADDVQAVPVVSIDEPDGPTDFGEVTPPGERPTSEAAAASTPRRRRRRSRP